MTLPGMTKPLKPIPVFKQMPGERKKQFYHRMNQTVQVILSIYVVKRIKSHLYISIYFKDMSY